MGRKTRATLQEKNGKYYIVVSYYNLEGKRKMKWISTGLKWNDENELEAERKRIDILKDWQKKELTTRDEITVLQYYNNWLYNIKKNEVRDNTFYSYELIYNKYVKPYFKEHNLKLMDINVKNIQDFYVYIQKIQDVTPNNLRKIHANVSSCLSAAVYDMYLTTNPAAYVKLPKKRKFKAVVPTKNDITRILQITKDTNIESAVFLTCYLGFRRSEILGLRFSDIDFDNNTISIKNTVIKVGGKSVFKEDSTKNDTSSSILPMSHKVKEYLLNLKEKNYSNWICCYRDTGEPLKPDYLSKTFTKIINKNGLNYFTFHCLRHSCATLLLESGMEMHLVQQILRHNQISTTVDIYGEATLSGKKVAADKMDALLS